MSAVAAASYRPPVDSWPTVVQESEAHYQTDDLTDDSQCAEFMNSAQLLHRRIKHLHRHGNQVRAELIGALRVLHEEQTYQELGYSSFPQYCERELGISKSTAYEWLSTGIRLDHLPGIRTLHSEGELSWEQTREIAKVATAETEREWAQFAIDHSARELRAEVKDAQAGNRDRPRSREHGLPNVRTKVVLELTRDERERFETMLRIVREGEADEGDEDEPSAQVSGSESLKDSLMRLVDRFLSGRLESAAADSDAAGTVSAGGAPRTRQAVVYQHCPECLESRVHTSEGSVRVDAARIEELEDFAERVVLDPDETLEVAPLEAGVDSPNTAQLVRKVLHRDGMRCCNPGCRSRHQLQSHHLVFRSEGGRTILANEITVCSRCHALIHEGLLEVTGSASRGAADLVWTPVCQRSRDRVRELDEVWSGLRTTRPESAAADSSDCVRCTDTSMGRPPVPRVRGADSCREHDSVDSSAASGVEMDDLVRALVKLGYDKDVAERDLRRAIDALTARGEGVSEEAIIGQVFASKRTRNRGARP